MSLGGQRPLKIAGTGARHEGFLWCPLGAEALFRGILPQSHRRYRQALRAPARVWASARRIRGSLDPNPSVRMIAIEHGLVVVDLHSQSPIFGLHFAAAFQALRHGDLVGEIEVAADWYSHGDAGYLHAQRLEQPREINCSG